MQRRIFLRAGTLTLLAFCLTGCSTIEDEILAWVQMGIPAVTQILQLLVSVGVLACVTCSEIATGVIVALQAIAAAIKAWKANPNATTIDDISAALQAALAVAASYFSSFTLPTGNPNTVSLIDALISLVLNTLSGYIGKLGLSTKASAKPVPKEYRRNGKMLPITPTFLQAGQFRTQWNALGVQYGHPEVKL